MLRLFKRRDRQRATEEKALGLSIDELIATHNLRYEKLVRQRNTSYRPGDWRGIRRGRGVELESIGPYQAGDDIRHMDWQSTARTGRPQVKRFFMDIQWTIMLMVDLRPSMYFGTRRQLMAKTACLMAARLGFSLSQSHQPVGYAFIDNNGVRVLPPRRGRSARLQYFNDIVEFYRRGQTSAFEPVVSLDRILERANIRLQRDVELVLISDFSHPGADLTEQIARFNPPLRRIVLIEDGLLARRPPRGRYPSRIAGGQEIHSIAIGRAGARADDDYRKHVSSQRRDLWIRLHQAGVTDLIAVNAASVTQGDER